MDKLLRTISISSLPWATSSTRPATPTREVFPSSTKSAGTGNSPETGCGTGQGGATRSSSEGSGAPSEPRSDRASNSEPSHILPIQQGGLTMSELRRCMVADADIQDKVMPVICRLLQRTVTESDQYVNSTRPGTTPQAAAITPSAYVRRIIAHGASSPCGILVGMMYLERLRAKMPGLRLTSNNFQEFLCVACNLGSKFCDDDGLSNTDWAAKFGGGMSLQELNALELEVLFELDFKLGVTPAEYKAFLGYILDDAMKQLTASPNEGGSSLSSSPSGPTAAAKCESAPKGCKFQSSMDLTGKWCLVKLPEERPGRVPAATRRAGRRAWGAHVHE